MDVFVRKPGKKASQRGVFHKMSLSERQTLEAERSALDAQRRDISYESHPDKGSVDDRIKKLDEMLGADSENEATGRERNSMAKRQKILAEQIKLRVPPMSMQRAKPGTPEYGKAIDWAVKACEPETVKMCEEYQAISRALDPMDPNAGSIEALVG